MERTNRVNSLKVMQLIRLSPASVDALVKEPGQRNTFIYEGSLSCSHTAGALSFELCQDRARHCVMHRKEVKVSPNVP